MDPHLLDLRRSTGDLLIGDNTIKADIFATRFFPPKTGIVVLNNIAIEAIIDQRVFNISLSILMEEVSKLIRSLLNGKALGLDGILNKIFKVIALVIIKDLAEIASYCLASEITPKRFKKFITVVLRKKEKKNYSLLSSYKLITFKTC